MSGRLGYGEAKKMCFDAYAAGARCPQDIANATGLSAAYIRSWSQRNAIRLDPSPYGSRWPNRTMRFCRGHTIPEDGPTLADVLDALGKLREAVSMGPLDIAAKYGPDGPSPDELIIGAAGYVDLILAALPKTTPETEES